MRKAGNEMPTSASSLSPIRALPARIPAAMMLVYVRALFRQAAREARDPRAIVSRLAEAVYVETHGESYLTCIVARLDEQTRQLTATTAGHPPALVTGSTLSRLTRGGPPAGLFPKNYCA